MVCGKRSRARSRPRRLAWRPAALKRHPRATGCSVATEAKPRVGIRAPPPALPIMPFRRIPFRLRERKPLSPCRLHETTPGSPASPHEIGESINESSTGWKDDYMRQAHDCQDSRAFRKRTSAKGGQNRPGAGRSRESEVVSNQGVEPEPLSLPDDSGVEDGERSHHRDLVCAPRRPLLPHLGEKRVSLGSESPSSARGDVPSRYPGHRRPGADRPA